MADVRPDQLAPFETREKLQRTPLLAQLRNMSNYMLGEPEPQGVVSRNLGAADRMPSDGMQAGGGATIVTSVSPVTPIQQVAPSFGEQGGFPGTTDLSGIDGSTQQRQRFAIDAPPSTYWQQPAGPPPSHPERQSAFHGVSAPDFSSGQVGLPNLSSDGRGMAPSNVPDSLLGSNFPSLPSGGRGLAPTNAAVRGEMGATDSLLVG